MSPPRKPSKPKDQQPEGITKITVKGFKSLAEEESIDIRPLTILAGANSSGKSSIMQPLLLMKQTLEASVDPPGPLRLDGENVRFSQWEQMASKLLAAEAVPEFEVTVAAGELGAVTNVFRRDQHHEPELVKTVVASNGGEMALRPGMSHDEIARVVPEELEAFRRDYPDGSDALRWEVVRARCFLYPEMVTPDRTRAYRLAEDALMPVTSLIGKVVHLPGLRGNPRRTYDLTAVGPAFPGTFEEYTASVVHHWQETGAPQAKQLAESVGALGLTWKVKAARRPGRQLELQVGRLHHAAPGGSRDLVAIADVGFGVSQVLPVVVALLAARRGQLLYIEQPEIHLHPRAQVALAGLLVDAANRGVRVVAETHSSLLLLAIQTLVASKAIEREKVILHWFKRRDGDGVTKVSKGEPDESGATKDWPEDFSAVEMRAENAFLDAFRSGRGRT